MPGLDNTTSITIGGIECWDEGVRESIGVNGSSATRTMVCRWADRYKLINFISPGATSVGGIYLFQAIPYPDNPSLLPQQFDIEGIPPLSVGENGMVAYDKARIVFQYGTPRGGDANGFVELNLTTSFLTLGKAAVTLETVNSDGNDPQPVAPNDAPGVPFTTIGFTRGVRNMAGLPIGVIRNCAKKPISSASFAGYEAGEVIFEGLRAIRQTASNTGSGVDGNGNEPNGSFDIDGPGVTTYSGTWDCEFQFTARPGLPWDYLARFKDGKFDGFGKARYAQGKGDFIGRSDIAKMLERSSGPPITFE